MQTTTLIHHAIIYLENHLSQPASIERAAAAAGYSRSHFSRTFAALTGLTPLGYLRRRRLSEAARELVTSPKRILDVALDYQFQSQEAFTRSFQQEFGASPGRYRRQGRLRRLLERIRFGFSNLLYPGRGLSPTPPILLPQRPLLAVILLPGARAGRSLAAVVAPVAAPTVKLRLAHRQDIPALCRLYHELHEFTTRGVPDRLRNLGEWECFDAAGLSRSLDKLLDALEMAIWVAEVNGQVVGLAEVYLRTDGQNANTVAYRYGYLQSLVVDPHLRGRGIGRQLLTAAEAWCKAQEASELRLDTWEFDRGPLDFYTHQGYRTLRRTLVRKL